MNSKEGKETDLTMLAYPALEAIRKDYYEEQQAEKKGKASA